MARKTVIDRSQAMGAFPVKAPVVKTEKKDGKLYVTVEFDRPAWQRFLGAERWCRRTYGLDAYGQEVYALCDGETTVKAIIGRFAKRHHLSLPESELAVTAFMKTLMAKGLIGMAVEKNGKRSPNAE